MTGFRGCTRKELAKTIIVVQMVRISKGGPFLIFCFFPEKSRTILANILSYSIL